MPATATAPKANGKARPAPSLIPASDEQPATDGASVYNVPASCVKILLAAARESSRYAINGALLERDGTNARLVATDGHKCAILDCPDLDGVGNDSTIIPAPFLKAAAKMCGKGDTLTVRVHKGGKITVSVRALFGEVSMTGIAVEGTFPTYRDVIPKLKDGDAVPLVAVNAKYLRDICDMAEMVGTRDGCPPVIEWRANHAKKPVLVTVRGDERKLTCVVMPAILPA